MAQAREEEDMELANPLLSAYLEGQVLIRDTERGKMHLGKIKEIRIIGEESPDLHMEFYWLVEVGESGAAGGISVQGDLQYDLPLAFFSPSSISETGKTLALTSSAYKEEIFLFRKI